MHEREYLDALCNTGDGVYIVDANKHIVRWNEAAGKMLRFPESEVMNHDCYRVIAGRGSHEKPLCGQNCRIHASALNGSAPRNFDMLTRTNEGNALWLNVSIITAPNGSAPYVAHIIRDITRSKKRELALNHFLAALEDHGSPEDETHAESSEFRLSPEKPPTALSGREIEVLTLLAEGMSTKSLAQKLNISHFTARNHIQNILVKLDLHSKAQAVSYAFKKGIL